MNIIPRIDLDILADGFLEDVLAKENFGTSSAKGGFLTGGNVLVCESKGLQWYLQKKCVDKHGIWTALPFKPLAGLLMQCAYNLSSKELKKDEKENVFNASNLVWAIYALLEGEEKTFSFANELASLFFAYQVYRPNLIEAWNGGKPYETSNTEASFKKNEKWQRELWGKLKAEHKNEPDISELYKIIENSLKNPKSEKKFLLKRIFIFAPLSIAPIHLKTLTLLAKADCKVNLYLLQISKEYIGDTKSEKSIAYLRKKSWAENKITDKNCLYWDLGNRLIANLGRSAQILYEQIGWENLEPPVCEPKNANSLLEKIQEDIINDNNSKSQNFEAFEVPHSLTLNSCFSPLREVEVLCDYILDLFVEQKMSPADIAVVSPNIETYASAVEMVFDRYKIPYKIADRDVKKYDKTAQLLKLLFSLIGSRYEAPDVVALFEYSMFVQGKEPDSRERESLEKYVRENAIRHGLNSSDQLPNYSFKSGLDQLAAGFFMISENGFSEKCEYCYPDIEGSSAKILGSFAGFVNALERIEEESKKEKSIEEWDSFLKENLQMFFGSDETDFNEDDNPYQKVISIWDSLKQEMRICFGDAASVEFFVLKEALLGKITAKSSYSLNGEISFSNIETARAVPHRVICCIGMNGREFPRQNKSKELSLINAEPRPGDKDRANEDRLMFLETICSARKRLYISWVGQDEKTAEDVEPSGAVVMLLENLKEQYGLDAKNIVAKHPLQPFSRKYFNGTKTLSTYDNRWLPATSGNWPQNGLNRIWEWEIDYAGVEEKRDIDALYRILSDAPKYFLKDVCNIELPEEISLLENIEPLTVENALDKWQLMKWVLDGEEGEKIKIEKLRGELPSGRFADKIMEKIIKEAEELRNKAKEESLKYLIYPGKDKGKYRLKHWLFHLEQNLKENQDTKMFLIDKTIKLPGIPKKKAGEILDRLWELKRKLEKRMLPIFPDAAFEYANSKKPEKAWEKINLHSQYAKAVIGSAETFKDLGIEEKFVECSEILFSEYNGNNFFYILQPAAVTQ